MKQAQGTFVVQLTPQTPAHPDADVGHLRIDKQFSGDLSGSSKGEMLSALTATDGSAGYVAMERVTAMLEGRSGSFVLQHSGTMNRGAQQLTISVVPDSGSGELTGIAGTMTIAISEGVHRYEFSYSLP